MNETDNMRDANIYTAYTRRKQTGEKVPQILQRFEISRATLYNVIERVEKGDQKQINIKKWSAHLDALWEHKYRTRFMCIPENRLPDTVEQVKKLIRDMFKDKFPVVLIAKNTNLSRSTVLHHLEKI